MTIEERLVEMNAAMLQTQLVVLAGMIRQGVVDPVAMRDWLRECFDGLKPEERDRMYGVCLAQLASAIEKKGIPRPAGHRPH